MTDEPAVLLTDRLDTIHALVNCAFMACGALDDETQCDALQTLLAQVDTLVREAATQAACLQ